MNATATTTTTPAALPTATIADLLSWGPCYPESRIRDLAGGRETFTALDVLGLDAVPANDRLWVVRRPELIDERTLRLWACWCVRHTPLVDGRTTWDLLGDERSRHAVEVAERFARGEASEGELSTARSAAWSAAESTARSAAWSAAESAAESAARSAQIDQLKAMLGELA